MAEAIQTSDDDLEIYTSGATNIFKYPELSTSEKASELISAFEDKKELADIISQDVERCKPAFRFTSAGESPVATMQDCSVVTATYELGDGMYGKIGVIGPKRMDYEKVVGTMKTLMAQLDEIFKKRKAVIQVERCRRKVESPVEENRNEELSKEAAETETTETAAEEQAATEDTREAAAEPEEKDDASVRGRGQRKRKASSERKRKIKKTHRLKNLQIGYSGRWQNLTTSANVPKKRRQQCLRLARRA